MLEAVSASFGDAVESEDPMQPAEGPPGPAAAGRAALFNYSFEVDKEFVDACGEGWGSCSPFRPRGL